MGEDSLAPWRDFLSSTESDDLLVEVWSSWLEGLLFLVLLSLWYGCLLKVQGGFHYLHFLKHVSRTNYFFSFCLWLLSLVWCSWSNIIEVLPSIKSSLDVFPIIISCSWNCYCFSLATDCSWGELIHKSLVITSWIAKSCKRLKKGNYFCPKKTNHSCEIKYFKNKWNSLYFCSTEYIRF